MKRLGVCGLALTLFAAPAVVVLEPASASAADKASSEDNQLEMKGREAFAAGRYDEAVDAYAKLYAKSLNPVYLRNLGRCFQKKREPQKAIDDFQDYLAKTKSGKYKIKDEERAEIQGYIKEMEALRDEQARAAAPPPPVTPVTPVQPLQPTGAAPPPPVAPPPDTSPTGPAATLTATAPPREESHPIYTRWWFWTIIGAAVVGGVVTAVALSSGTTKPDCPTGVKCQ